MVRCVAGVQAGFWFASFVGVADTVNGAVSAVVGLRRVGCADVQILPVAMSFAAESR